MKIRNNTAILLALFGMMCCLNAGAQGTGFTYQGRLNDGASPANGSYDLTFTLYDAVSGGTQQGSTLTNAATTVSNGLFNVTLDFGNQFPGADRWLEIGVATNGGGAFATLSPRQPITATPYAIQAATANTAVLANSVNASNLLGILSLAQLPPGVVTNSASGIALAGVFSGDGSGLLNLNASQLTSGTVPMPRLPDALVTNGASGVSLSGFFTGNGDGLTNVGLLNGANVFSGTNRFSNVVLATNANSQFSGAFSGTGSGLTSLSPANIAPGTAAINISGSANNFSGALVGDVTGSQSATVVANVGGQSAAAVANGASAANAATSANTANTIVKRDASGNFSAGIITANGSALTNLSATNISSGVLADQRLSSNVALLNGTNVFSGTNRFSNVVIATNLNNQFLGLFTGNGAALTNLAAANLTGTVGLGQLPSSVLTNGASGLSLSGSFTGNGSGLTNLDLGQNSAGSIQTLSFTLASQLAAGNGSFTVLTADVNNDGRPDLIDARYTTPATFIVFTNNGSGGFVASSTNTSGAGSQPRRGVAVDVNNDTRIDLIFTHDNSTVEVWTNNGSGGFASSQSFGPVGSIPQLIATDLNGDSKPDIAVTDFSGSAIRVYTNNGSGVFVTPPTVFATFSQPSDVTAADINNDGKVDLISSSGSGPFVFTNNGSAVFGYWTNLTSFAANKLVSVDVNGDGRPDIATTVSLGNNRLAIYTNNGIGGFALASSPFAATGGFANGIFAADMDGDGRQDLLVPCSGTNSISIMINTGGGNFALKTALPTGTQPQSAACADFNGDGRTDLAAGGGATETAGQFLDIQWLFH